MLPVPIIVPMPLFGSSSVCRLGRYFFTIFESEEVARQKLLSAYQRQFADVEDLEFKNGEKCVFLRGRGKQGRDSTVRDPNVRLFAYKNGVLATIELFDEDGEVSPDSVMLSYLLEKDQSPEAKLSSTL